MAKIPVLPLAIGGGALIAFLALSKKSSGNSTVTKPKRVGRKDEATPNVPESQYWTKDTELNVTNQIKFEITKYKNKDICGDSEKLVNGIRTFIPNPYALKIVKTVITNLWKTSNIKESMLPPKDSDPAWLWTIWNRVNNIYFEVVCGIPRI